MDAEPLVERDQHAVSAALPLAYLLRFQPHGTNQSTVRVRGFGLQVADHLHRQSQIPAGHHVGVAVVVHHGGVLVGTGHPVDLEGLTVTYAPETEIGPHAGGFDDQFGSLAAHELPVCGHGTVVAYRIRDVGVDVVLGGTSGVVGGGLFAVDGSPREQRASDR